MHGDVPRDTVQSAADILKMKNMGSRLPVLHGPSSTFITGGILSGSTMDQFPGVNSHAGNGVTMDSAIGHSFIKEAIRGTNSKKIKNVIDELYDKEKRYVKQYIRDDFIEPNSCIFELDRSHKLAHASIGKKGAQSKFAGAVDFNRVGRDMQNEMGSMSTFGIHKNSKSFGDYRCTKNDIFINGFNP
jgi:hypothetical protein